MTPARPAAQPRQPQPAPGGATPDLTVVVPSWNTRALLADCLAALPAAADGLALEAIVVDDASHDGSPALVRDRFSWARLHAFPQNRGFVAACNQGLALARGRHVLLLNSDTVPAPGAFTAMVWLLDADPAIGAVGANLRNPDGSAQPCWGRFPGLLSECLSLLGLDRRLPGLAAGWARPLPPGASGVVEADWVLGACLLVRGEVAGVLGGLDPGFRIYSEEVDWCRRIKAAGWRVVVAAEARVLHHGASSTRQAPGRLLPELYRSKRRYLRKHRGRLAASFYGLVLALAALGHLALLLPRRGAVAAAERGAWWSVLRGLW